MDLGILEYLESIRTGGLDVLFSLITHLGSEWLIVPGLCILLWCVNKEAGYRVGLILFLSLGVNQLLKVVFSVPRPWVRWPDRITPVSAALEGATGYSFPSGHTGMATAFYPVVAAQAPAHRRGFAMAAAVVTVVAVGFSRVYLGVHTPSDVVFSVLTTLAVAIPVYFLYPRLARRKSKATLEAVTLIAGVAGLGLAGWVLLQAGGFSGLPEETDDLFKTAGGILGFAIGWGVERRWIRWSVQAPVHMQVVKVLAGLTGMFLLRELGEPVLSALSKDPLIVHSVRYLLVTVWATAGLPAVFTRLQPNRVRQTSRPC